MLEVVSVEVSYRQNSCEKTFQMLERYDIEAVDVNCNVNKQNCE